MANFVCFLAARAAKAPLGRAQGRAVAARRRPAGLRVDGNPHLDPEGRRSVRARHRRHPLDCRPTIEQRMDPSALRRQIEQDLAASAISRFSSSAPRARSAPAPSIRCREIAAICREHELWFHVDGAYGALAAQAPGAPASLRALSEADSVAVDPHKWLYAPLEAGCVLVRDAAKLRNAFSYHPRLLPLRRSGRELLRLRPAEFARASAR